MKIAGATCVVSGANRGIGQVLARRLVAAGATVHAGARDPGSVRVPGARPLRLDITDADSIAAAVQQAPETTILFNNAGVSAGVDPLDAPDLDGARLEMETNFFGTLQMCRAFAPVLAANGGGAIVNQLSVVSWIAPPRSGTYSASKAAEWALTNLLRSRLRDQGTLVLGVHVSWVDTDMADHVQDQPKISADALVDQILQGLQEDAEEVLADERTRHVKAALPHDLENLYPH